MTKSARLPDIPLELYTDLKAPPTAKGPSSTPKGFYMTESPITCMRCDGNLEVGFLLDRVLGGGRDAGHPLLWANSSHVSNVTPINEDGVHQIEATPTAAQNAVTSNSLLA
ncbi:MAG: hypothetical protein ACI87A_002830 [Planctomycetota bacterium]|jgi:hypothetical protein